MRLWTSLVALGLLLAVAGTASEARSEAKPSEVTTAGEARSQAKPSEVTTGGEARGEAEGRAKSSSWSAELERELMSPYCPGRSLVECPSPQATELRLWIQAQERAGVPRANVEARLFEQFGDQLRHGPRAEGFGLWAYLVPAGALVAGGVLVLAFLRRQGGPEPAPPEASLPRDPELERRLEEELAG
jgi:cytochrome c-type biogenesis protein CcmH/NrfF